MQGARADRVAQEIRGIVAELLVRQEIKDHAVRDVELITVSHVKVTGDLRNATVLFMVHGVDEKKLEDVASGLNRAAGFVRGRIKARLRMKVIPSVEFAIDRVYASGERVERVFSELEAERESRPWTAGDGETDPHVPVGDGESE